MGHDLNHSYPAQGRFRCIFIYILLVTLWQEVLGGFLLSEKTVLNITYWVSFINFYFV